MAIHPRMDKYYMLVRRFVNAKHLDCFCELNGRDLHVRNIIPY